MWVFLIQSVEDIERKARLPKGVICPNCSIEILSGFSFYFFCGIQTQELSINSNLNFQPAGWLAL